MVWLLLCCLSVVVRIPLINSFSACDEIDVTFVVDTDTIIEDGDAVIEFITSIINDGSSEQTGFSVVVYGDKIPNDLEIAIITLEETQDLTQRAAAEAEVDEKLQEAFNLIIDDHNEGLHGETVELLQAFQIGNEQHRPQRSLAYKTKLGYDVDDPSIGGKDDEKVYFIFDFDNKLMYDDDMDDICELFHHLDTNAVENDDESIYFMMGQEFSKYDVRNIECNNKTPTQIKKNTFWEFEDELLFNRDKMEQIYDITCPAVVESKHGKLNLGNHVQWVDLETVLKCNLEYYDFHDKTKQDLLDIEKSFMKVKDYLNDDNTFKKNDYLLSNPKILDEMGKRGCSAPVVKIEKIRKYKKIYNRGDLKKEYQILNLYLTLPESPLEYILDADVNGNQGVHVDDAHIDPYNNPYQSAYDEEFYGVSIEDAGIDYLNTLNEDEAYQYIKKGLHSAITYLRAEDHDHYAANWIGDDLDDEYNQYDNDNDDDDQYDDDEYDDGLNENLNDFYKFMDEYNGGEYGEYDAYFDDNYDDDDDDNNYAYYNDDEYEIDDLNEEAFMTIYDFFNLEQADFDEFDNDDVDELYEIFDEYMYYRYGIDYYGDDIPGLSSVYNWGKKKVKAAGSYVKKKATQTKNYVKKKAGQAKEYGKKKVEQAKKFVKKKVEQVKDAVDKLATIKKKGTKKLANLDFKKDGKWEKTKTAVKNIKGARGLKITFKGKGTLTLTWGYWFKFQMSASYNFYWKVFKGDIHIEFKLHGNWEIGCHFGAKLKGQLEVMMKNLLNYGKTFILGPFGPVIVVLRPFISLDAKLKTLPVSVYGGVRCTYAQTFAVGYVYNKKQKKNNRIEERKTIKKGCKPELKINEFQNEGEECPVAKLGFNLYIQPKIGVSFYYLINVALGFQFVIPFRITMPEQDLKRCGGRTGEMCNTSDKKLFASFTVSMHLNVYGYAYIDTARISSVIQNLLKKKKPSSKKLKQGIRKTLASKVKIMGKKSLGCLKLPGVLNNHYRGKCCKGSSGGGGGSNGGDTGGGGGEVEITKQKCKYKDDEETQGDICCAKDSGCKKCKLKGNHHQGYFCKNGKLWRPKQGGKSEAPVKGSGYICAPCT